MIVAIMGYKGGIGKSTVCNLVGDVLTNYHQEETVILNMDFYQTKNKDINSTATFNVAKDAEINIEALKESGFKHIIIDGAGFADKRLLEIKHHINYFIFPTCKGLRAILDLKEVMKDMLFDGAKGTVLLNMSNHIREYKETLEAIKMQFSDLTFKSEIKIMQLNTYQTVEKMENEQVGIIELYNKQRISAYKKIIDKIDDIITDMKG